jgi:hypothetical protein
MPSTIIKYGTSATQTVTAARDWSNLANLTLAPDDVQATVTALLLTESTEPALIGPDGLGIVQPPGFVPQSVTLTPRVSDSGYSEGVSIQCRLYDGTTPIGNTIAVNATAAALTTYTITGTAAQWGVTLTRALISRLRVSVTLVAVDGTSNVGIDSCGVVVGGIGGSARSRLSRARSIR